MAGSVNKVILIGNLGADPETRHLESGATVTKFSIATTEAYTNKNGEKVENTEWHRVELWEGLAKVAEKYLRKGSQVYIEGKLKTDTWTDNEGAERRAVGVRGTSMTLLGGSGNPRTPDEGLTNGQPPQNRPPQSPATPKGNVADDDDDLPF